MPLYSFEGRSPTIHPTAEVWVSGNPAAYQELARRYLAGFGEA